MLINGASLQGLTTAFNTIFAGAFNSTQTFWEKVAMLVPSSTSVEEYDWLGDLADLREWVGDRVVANLIAHSYSIKNKTFEKTIGVKRERIEDDQYGVYNPRFAILGENARRHPDKLIFSLLKDGFSTPCYDKQNFFDTDHPVLVDGVETSVSNYGGGSGAPWFLMDTSRAVKPMIFQKRKDYVLEAMDKPDSTNVFMRAEYLYGIHARCNVGFSLWQLAHASKQTLEADSYAAARGAMMSVKADNGDSLGVVPNLLVVPPSLEGVARKILKNALATGGETNEWAGTADVLVVPYLA